MWTGRRKEEEKEEPQGWLQARQRQRDTETPNTHALARTTLRITSESVASAHVRACTFKALASSTHKKLAQQTVRWVRVPRRVERDHSKTRLHVSLSSKAVLWMAASGAHARPAHVNEPSGACFFSGVCDEIGHRTHDHGAQFKAGT